MPLMKRRSFRCSATVLLSLAFFVPPARAGVTERSYVQKGLVACYDGIDNAGTGVHDSNAATWADLSGNGFDGTLASNLGWAADGWTNAVDGSGVQVGTRLADALSLGAFTIRSPASRRATTRARRSSATTRTAAGPSPSSTTTGIRRPGACASSARVRPAIRFFRPS